MPVRGPFDIVVDGVDVHYKLYEQHGKGTSKFKIKCCKEFDSNDPLPEAKWKQIGMSSDGDDNICSRIRENLAALPSGASVAFLFNSCHIMRGGLSSSCPPARAAHTCTLLICGLTCQQVRRLCVAQM